MLKKVVSVLLIAVVITTVISGCGASQQSRIYDVSGFAKYSYQGYNGDAFLFVSRDAEQFRDITVALIDEVGEEQAQRVGQALDSIQFTIVDDRKEIFNGDEIAITAQYDEELAKAASVTFTNTEFTYTVEGLEEPRQIPAIQEEMEEDDPTEAIPSQVEDAATQTTSDADDSQNEETAAASDEFVINYAGHTLVFPGEWIDSMDYSVEKDSLGEYLSLHFKGQPEYPLAHITMESMDYNDLVTSRVLSLDENAWTMLVDHGIGGGYSTMMGDPQELADINSAYYLHMMDLHTAYIERLRELGWKSITD